MSRRRRAAKPSDKPSSVAASRRHATDSSRTAKPHATKPRSTEEQSTENRSRDASTSTDQDWTRYRPSGHPIILMTLLAVFAAWIGFLILTILGF